MSPSSIGSNIKNIKLGFQYKKLQVLSVHGYSETYLQHTAYPWGDESILSA